MPQEMEDAASDVITVAAFDGTRAEGDIVLELADRAEG